VTDILLVSQQPTAHLQLGACREVRCQARNAIRLLLFHRETVLSNLYLTTTATFSGVHGAT